MGARYYSRKMSISKDVAATEPLVSVQIKLLGLKETMSVGKGPKTQTTHISHL